MARSLFRRPCTICGQLTEPGESRCPVHKINKAQLYNAEYRRQRAYLVATATHCHLCGEAFTDRKDITADHLLAGDPKSPLLAAHSRCNYARGNKPL